MKRFAYLAMAVLMPVTGLAQSNYSFDDEVNAELEKMYQGPSGSSSAAKPVQAQTGPQVQVNVATTQSTTQTAPATTQVAPVSQPVAVNQPVVDQPITAPAAAAVAAPVVQKQETTLIEATPLKESKAESLRKSRQDAEIATEQGIVVKLEESRLEDEKRRSEVLFGDKFNSLATQTKTEQKQDQEQGALINNSPNATVIQQQGAAATTVPVIAPAVVEAPVVVAPPVKEDKKDEIRSEVRAQLNEIKEDKPASRSYFSGLAGMGDYNVRNVRGNYSLGFAFGQKFNDHILAEGSFLYSNFDVEQRDGGIVCDPYNCTAYPRITRMDQYAGSAVVKYQFLNGTIRPVVGGILSYVYRTFSDSQFGNSSNYAQSHALDLGLTGGVDVEVSDRFTIGLDARYMWNLTNRTNTSGFQQSFSRSVYGSDTPIEQLSYLNIGLVGRVMF